jgi:hypothetical protein
MKRILTVIAAGVVMSGPTFASAQTAPGQGQYHGQGYDHMNGPSSTGQPSQDCEDLIASGEGSDPGNSARSGSSAFGGSAGDVYAGSQPQNSRNTASVSQYDVACLFNQSPQQ